MADKNPIEAALAASIHQAEYETGKANAAPAGAGKARPDRQGRCRSLKRRTGLRRLLRPAGPTSDK